MQAFHIPGAAPLYTNTFLLISDAGHAVVIDPAADAQTYDKILKENNAKLTLRVKLWLFAISIALMLIF